MNVNVKCEREEKGERERENSEFQILCFSISNDIVSHSNSLYSSPIPSSFPGLFAVIAVLVLSLTDGSFPFPASLIIVLHDLFSSIHCVNRTIVVTSTLAQLSTIYV